VQGRFAVDTGILGEIQEILERSVRDTGESKRSGERYREIWMGRFRGHAGRFRTDTEKSMEDTEISGERTE
jgi:hypothetical protein